MTKTEQNGLDRRRFLTASGGVVLISSMPVITAFADQDDMMQARSDLFGDRPIQNGRVMVELPPIAENGHSVPLSVSVDSQMTSSDYVKRVAVFSPRNPLPNVAQFHFTPRSGKAQISTRIRLSGTQAIQAVAEMSDGSLWSGSKETVVTLAACVVL